MLTDLREFWAFLLVFARVSALVATAPVFAGRSVPRAAKIGLAGLVSFAAVPLVIQQVGRPPADLFSLVARISAEVAVGVCIGFCASLIFAAIQIAGTVIDTQIGFGIINVLNPYTEQATAVMGQFVYQLALTMFLIGNGHMFLVGSVVGSFDVVGPGAAHFSGDVSGAFTSLVARMFLLGFQVALPAAAVLVIVDVSFAIVARAVPQMNIFIVGMPAKVLVGIVTLAFALPALAAAMGQMMPAIEVGVRATLTAAR